MRASRNNAALRLSGNRGSRLSGCRILLALGGKVVAVPEIRIEDASQFRRVGSEDGDVEFRS